MDVFKRFAREFLADTPDLPRLVIGFSGGADSVFLLIMLAQLYKTSAQSKSGTDALLAVHVNHGLRSAAESEGDEDFCRRFCLERGLRFKAIKLAPAQKDKSLISEEWLRDERYRVLTEEALKEKTSYVVCGHHRDDQAETVLFRLLRGTGSSGAAAMRRQRPLSEDVILLRPMLTFSRVEIEKTLENLNIAFVTDSTNSDSKYKRNFLRQQVFPLLEGPQGFPAARKNLADFASSLACDDALLNKLAEDAYPQVFVYSASGAAIKVECYLNLHESLRVRVCREFCRLHGVPFERAVYQRLSQVLSGESERQELLNGLSAILTEDQGAAQKSALVTISDTATLDYEESDVTALQKRMDDITVQLPVSGSKLKIIPWLSLALRVEAFEKGEGPAASEIAAFKKCGDYLLTEFVDLSSLIVTPDCGGRLSFRSRRSGDKFCPLAGRESTLKRYLHGQGGSGSPKWSRFLESSPGFCALSDNCALLMRVLPVLAKGDEVLWLPGFAPSQQIAVPKGGRATHRLELLPLSHHLENYDDEGTKTC